MTSTTNRATCLCGSHSSIDGGRRKQLVRSVGRKLARGKCPDVGANRRYDSNMDTSGSPGLKSDRLLARIMHEGHWARACELILDFRQRYLAALFVGRWGVLG